VPAGSRVAMKSPELSVRGATPVALDYSI